MSDSNLEMEYYRLMFMGLPLGPMKMDFCKRCPDPAFLRRASRPIHFPDGSVGLIHIFVAHVVPAGRRSVLDQHCGTGLAPPQHALWTLP